MHWMIFKYKGNRMILYSLSQNALKPRTAWTMYILKIEEASLGPKIKYPTKVRINVKMMKQGGWESDFVELLQLIMTLFYIIFIVKLS